MNMFSLKDKTAVVLGGAGVLGAAISEGLAQHGASVVVADMALHPAQNLASKLNSIGVKSTAYEIDATSIDSLKKTCNAVINEFGSIDVLVNAVGGNRKDATCSETQDFFKLPCDAIESVVKLNLFAGAIMPSQVFGKCMADNPGGGSIINISSMNAFRPLTRIVGYSAAKAAVNNFTQWLAVDLARNGYKNLRVNAIAPGFFLTEQNRFLLTDEKTGGLTTRGETILAHTPMERFGEPSDLIGAIVWLASDASRFVTGIVVPIDGGFSAFSGV
jgi:NAD(P)-dependent dehydrogenase (short-subunit alcohol dehydrogenase family)